MGMLGVTAELPIIGQLNNVAGNLASVFGAVLVVIGVVLCFFGFWNLAKGLMGDGRSGGPEWVKILISILLGAAMIFGGWNMVTSITRGVADSASQMITTPSGVSLK